MVKIPGLDELKKMGTGLIDSAKAGKFSEMVDKVKSGIESVSSKKAPDVVTDEHLKNLFQGIFTTLNEFAQAQTIQVNALKKVEKQIEELARSIENFQNPPSKTTSTTTTPTEKKVVETTVKTEKKAPKSDAEK